MTILPIAHLPARLGFTWKQLGLLVLAAVALGFVMALTISLPVS